MSTTLSLKDFVQKKLAESRTINPSEQDIENWKLDVTVLFDQIHTWLKSADPEEIAFRVTRPSIHLDEYGIGYYEIQSMVIHFRVREGGRVTLTPRGINTQRSNFKGLVEMAGSIKKYYLFRQSAQGKTEAKWLLVDQDTNNPEPLTQQTFEAALQDLLT
jgi:hypothetical protein